jgi:Transcriptional regulator PadR-like family
MDEMERMSGGWWRPSPGSVYPLLEELSTEGVIKKRDDGRYELVEPMRGHYHGWPFPVAGPRSAEDALREIGSLTAYLEDLARSDPASFAASRAAAKGAAERLMRLAP